MIPASEVEALQDRINCLERKTRRVNRLLALIVVIVSAVFLMGQSTPQFVVEAHGLVLKDSHERIRAAISLLGDVPRLVMMDDRGQIRLTLGEEGLTFSDAQGRITSGFNGDHLRLFNSVDPKDGVGMFADSIGISSGSSSVILGMTDGMPGISLQRGSDVLGATIVAGPSLFLKDANGFVASIGKEESENPKTGQKTTTSAASVRLIGKDGNLLWQAP